MGEPREQLIVRRHDRLTCDIGVSVRVHEEQAEQIVFTRGIAESDGSVKASIVDCSLGGLGFDCSLYFPKGSRLIATIVNDDDLPGIDTRQFELRVMRSSMKERTPTYYLGTAASGDDMAEAMRRLVEAVRSDQSGTEAA